jgi:outer membrane immunogenic protein
LCSFGGFSMKKILLAAALLIGGAAGAQSADLAARPYTKAPSVAAASVYNWTGFYVGGHAGYGWGDATNEFSLGFFLGDPERPYQDMKGWLAGGHAGFNYQVDRFVFGIEGDGTWTDINSRVFSSVFPPDTLTSTGRIDWLASVRGRAGVAFDSVLFYATGGAAWASLSLTSQAVFNPGGIIARNYRDPDGVVHNGWVVGGGVEWMFAQNWIARAEYLHYEFEDKLHFQPGLVLGTPVDLKVDVVRAGVSYKFGWGSPIVAKY